MKKSLVAPVAALVVGAAVLAAVLQASLTRLPELDAEPDTAVSVRASLELEAVVWKARIKVGEPLPVEFRLRNVGEKPVWVVRSLPKSDTGRRYPKCGLEIRDASGNLRSMSRARSGCSVVDALTDKDFQKVEPGCCSDPLDHYMLGWKPERSGVYTLGFSYDSTPRKVRDWEPIESMRSETLLRLEGMPRGLFSARATVEVVD